MKKTILSLFLAVCSQLAFGQLDLHYPLPGNISNDLYTNVHGPEAIVFPSSSSVSVKFDVSCYTYSTLVTERPLVDFASCISWKWYKVNLPVDVTELPNDWKKSENEMASNGLPEVTLTLSNASGFALVAVPVARVGNSDLCNARVPSTLTGSAFSSVIYPAVSKAKVTGTTPICAGISTKFTGKPSGGTWKSSNATVATVSATGEVKAIAKGSVDITYTVNSPLTAPFAFTTQVLPVPVVPYIYGPSSQCKTSTAVFPYNASAGPNPQDYSYAWSTTIGTIQSTSGSIANLTFGPYANSSGTLKVTASNSCGTQTNTMNIVLDAVAPSAPAIPSGPTSVSDPKQNSTYNTTAVTSTKTWELTPSTAGTVNQIGTGGQAIVDWNDNFAGNTTLRVRQSNACGVSTWSPALAISVLPTCASGALVISGPSSVCNAGSVSYYSPGALVSWSNVTWGLVPASAGTITANGPYGGCAIDWSNSFTGTAQVTLKRNVDPCSSIPFNVTVANGSCRMEGADDQVSEENNASLSLFPNPSATGFQVQGLRAAENATIEILDAQGKVVGHYQAVGTGTVFGKELLPGVYSVRVAQASHNTLFKFVAH